MDPHQNRGTVTETVHAEMERPERIADFSDVTGDEQEEAATTSVEELLDILAELSERVTRLERAMVALLAEGHSGASEAPIESRSSTSADSYSEREFAPAPAPPPPPSRAAAPPPPRPAADALSAAYVDFDLPSHQWGAEGLTERARNTSAITPIQHSDYPEIRAPEEEQPAPKRTGPPERVIVRAALESYPHIVESVCLLWGGREADAFLNKLVIDTRGGRKGFPRDVMDDLLVLAEVCTIKSGLKPDFTPFDRDRTREREG